MSIKNYCNSADTLSWTNPSFSYKNKSESVVGDSSASDKSPPPPFEITQDKGGPHEDDTIARLTEWLVEDHCKRLVLGSALDYPPIFKDQERTFSIEGLGCQTNRSLNFVAIDSLLHGDLAAEFGLNLTSNIPRNTGALIIDHLAEERYTLTEPLSKNNIATFIYNYTNGFLSRSIKSSRVEFSTQSCQEGMECIADIDAYDYVNITQSLGKTYVVLHYSANCGACSAMSHLLLMAKHMTSEIENLEFLRVDVTKNTLPWHLTFDRVPTLIIYPAFRNSESRILDPSDELSLQSLLLFISYGLNEQQRQKLALNLCDDDCKKLVSKLSSFHVRKLQRDLSNVMVVYYRHVTSLNKLDGDGSYDSRHLDRYKFILQLKSIIYKRVQLIRKRISLSRSILQNVTIF